jgi:hypothetical protein
MQPYITASTTSSDCITCPVGTYSDLPGSYVCSSSCSSLGDNNLINSTETDNSKITKELLKIKKKFKKFKRNLKNKIKNKMK